VVESLGMRPVAGNRGLALLVTIGILGVLSVLATCFVTLARLERLASQRRVDATRAFLLARSGLEDALARLGAGQEPTYGGADLDGSGGISASELDLYALPYGAEDSPASLALRPSWPVLAGGSLSPVLIPQDDRKRGYSGSLRDGLETTYALKVERRNGFFVNGGDPAAAPDAGYNAVLRRVLGTLGEALNREEGRATSPADGLALVDSRPASGWQDFEEIRRVLGWDEAQAVAWKPYLCFEAWTDKRVIVPNAPIPPLGGTDVHSWGEIKLGRPVNASGSREPDFERSGVRIVGRAPVSLTWAAGRRPALIALVAGLAGVYLDEAGAAPQSATLAGTPELDFIGTLKRAEILNDWNLADDCHHAAVAIEAGGIAGSWTWQDFEAVCDGIDFTGTSAEVQAKRDILKANFNPNSDLNKFNPNVSLWRTVDKSDLTVYSTEFSLDPIQGLRVESAGRVLGPRGELLAQKVLQASLASPGILRISTQKEFVCGDLGNPDLPGDETGPRLPGHPGFLSENGSAQKTWGHRLDTAARHPASYLNGPAGYLRGAALQSYPEPCFDAGGGLDQHPADYDGRLELATVETPKDAFYTQASPSDLHDMRMLARYTGDFDLDHAFGGDALRRCQADAALVSGAELADGLLDPFKPSTLYPDGAYSERDRCPAYLDRGNVDGYHGVISFWVKNNFEMAVTPRAPHARGRRYLHGSNIVDRVANSNRNQFFFLGMARDVLPKNLIVFGFEGGRQDQDVYEEHRFHTEAPSAFPHRWRLLSLFWDSRARRKEDLGELVVNDGDEPSECCPDDLYSGSINPVYTTDITADDIGWGNNAPPGATSHRICLGPHNRFVEIPNVWQVVGRGADASFDEFGVWDMGGASEAVPDGTAIPDGGERGSRAAVELWKGPDFSPGDVPRTLASERYRDGRYYRGSAYGGIADPAARPALDQAASWLSAPIRLPADSRILAVSWTFRRPAELPDDFAEIALADLAGAGYLLPGGRCRSFQSPNWTASRQRWEPDLQVPGPFRLQAVFRRPLPLNAATPILDSPSLDDLTVLHQPRDGPRLHAFRWQ